MKTFRTITIAGFLVGAFVPLFWGVLGFVLFNVPEGMFSRAFWFAVYFTCPFWIVNGEKALILIPLLNGSLYAALFLIAAKMRPRWRDL
jgi:hypothetical protein